MEASQGFMIGLIHFEVQVLKTAFITEGMGNQCSL
jgi:hypothetical protein